MRRQATGNPDFENVKYTYVVFSCYKNFNKFIDERPLWKKNQWNLKQKAAIYTQANEYENVVGKMAVILSWSEW